MIYLWTTCSESETDVPLVFYTRKGAKQLGFKLVKVINMDNDNIIKQLELSLLGGKNMEAQQVGLNEMKPNKNMFALNLIVLGIPDITEVDLN